MKTSCWNRLDFQVMHFDKLDCLGDKEFLIIQTSRLEDLTNADEFRLRKCDLVLFQGLISSIAFQLSQGNLSAISDGQS